MIVNVRTLEKRIELGLVEGRILENTKATLDKIEHRDSRVDAWDVINNDGTYGTEIVITKEGHVDLYLCIKKRWSSYISYVRVGNFQPEFNLGDVQLMNGKEVEYQKLGNIINALNKEYEKYDFYFDTKSNRKILADARKAYIEEQNEIKMKKQEEEEVEKLQKALVEKEQELLAKTVTIDIDGEGSVEEIKDATYANANANYKRRIHQAPEKGNGYNKTFITIKVDGKKFHEVSMCLQSDTKYYTLKDALLAQIDVLRKTWVDGDGVPYLSPEKNQAVIEQKYGSKEKLAISLNAKELVIKNLGEKPEPTPEPEKKSGFEVRVIEISTGDAVQVMSATNMRMAERIERGVLMHLNREDYYVEIVDLSQSKTPEKEEITIEKKVEKMEEKEMKTINKNGLNNKMVKLGEFLKENRDKDAIENKVFELFPNAMEMEVFNDDDVVYFLVGQDYTGKAPTKKEMKELDYNFKEIDKVYGLAIYTSIDTDKIEMTATVGIDYTDKYGHYQYTDYTVKENIIELDLTVEKEINPEPEKDELDKLTEDSVEESGNAPEKEEKSELRKQIKEHVNAVIDLATKENNGVGYMYKKTIAVKRKTGYQLTSLFEDMWTGMDVYIGDSANMIMIPNSEKSFLTGIVDNVLSNSQSINTTVEEIQEKIKRKFEYSYSKSISIIEPDETTVYVLISPEGAQVFWRYEDAYNKMVKSAKETAEEWAHGKELIIDEYSAKVDTFKWTIMEKIVQ